MPVTYLFLLPLPNVDDVVIVGTSTAAVVVANAASVGFSRSNKTRK